MQSIGQLVFSSVNHADKFEKLFKNNELVSVVCCGEFWEQHNRGGLGQKVHHVGTGGDSVD